jgi:chitodextrinase
MRKFTIRPFVVALRAALAARRQILCVVTATLLTGICSASAQTIPAEYQALHNDLYASLKTFRTSIDQAWDGSTAPVAFSANLASAHSSRGPALLTPGLPEALEVEIDNLKALGVRAITLHVSFPMLYRPFHGSEAEYQQYLAFYVLLAQSIRARDLTLVVATQTLFSEPGLTPWNVGAYYDSLTLAEYQQGRMEVARTLATVLRPDYLSVIAEPDTEAIEAGKPELGTAAGSRALLDVILAGLQQAPVPGVAIGAGIGTWQPGYREFVESFASTSIDFIDMHLYPVTGAYLPRAIEIADIAASYGKQVGMTETWLYKVHEAELNHIPLAAIFKRDSYSFWAPLDGYHLQTMVKLAHYKRFAFLSPFWSGYFRAAVDYTAATKDLTWAELTQIAYPKLEANLLAGVYALPGTAYRQAILEPADAVPPATPGQLTAELTAPTSVALTWAPSSDNVGTAAYRVYRDGVAVAQTALRHFTEANLAEARPFVYTVVALDASGNVSTPATATVRTPDVTPPTVPLTFTATPTRVGSRLNLTLSWAPASDNVGVQQYRLTRGETPASLAVIAGPTTTSYTFMNVKPETTLYFGIAAIDPSQNVSTEAVIGVTTPALPDVTAPFVSVAYPADGAVVPSKLPLYALTYDVRGGTYDVPSGPVAVRFLIDGVQVGTEQTVPATKMPAYSVFMIDSPTLSAGEHQVVAVSRDLAGNVATSPPIHIIVR